MNIWLQPREGGEARPLTTFTDRPLPGYTWAYNNDQILFARDNDGDENTHVYVVSIADNKVVDLTPVDGVKAGIVEIHRDRPDEIVISINDRDPQFSDYDIVNLRTGERTKLIQNDDGFLGYFFNDEWSPLGRIKMTPEGGLLFEMQDDKGWFEYMNVAMEDSMTTQPTGLSKSGDTIYGIDSRNRDTAALVSMPAERGGADRPTVLFASDKADVSGSMMDPVTKVPQGVVVNYLREEWDPSRRFHRRGSRGHQEAWRGRLQHHEPNTRRPTLDDRDRPGCRPRQLLDLGSRCQEGDLPLLAQTGSRELRTRSDGSRRDSHS